MGKKLQGAALRAKKRQKAQVEELQEQQAEKVAQQSVVDQTDGELFVLDTTGDRVPRNQQQQPGAKKNRKSKGTVWTEREREAIDKLIQKHSKEQLSSMAEQGKKVSSMAEQGKKVIDHKSWPLRTHGIRKAKNETLSNAYDLWDSSSPPTKRATRPGKPQQPSAAKIGGVASLPAASVGRQKDSAQSSSNSKQPRATTQRNKIVSVDLAKPGQSYKPDFREHQKVLRDAVELEKRRDEAQAEKNAPISPGMKPETKALLLSDSDSSDDDDDDDAGDDVNIPNEEEKDDEEETPVFHKKTEKLTRAQRNKQKRVRREERERLEEKKRKQNENLVLQAKKFKKELNRDELAQKERQNEKRKRAEEQAAKDVGAHVEQSISKQDPIAAPSYPVALSSEVKGSSLRTMIPKGDLVTDRMASYAFRSLAPKLPSAAAAHKAKMSQQKRRPKKKVKGAKEWVGHDFVIMK